MALGRPGCLALSPCFTEVLVSGGVGEGVMSVSSLPPAPHLAQVLMPSCSEGRGEMRGGQSGSYYLARTVIVISDGLPLDQRAFFFF